MAGQNQTGAKVITLLDEVEKCEKDVIEALLAVPARRPVRLVINSSGGSVYASLAITTVMRMKRLQCEAVVLADCSSAALLVFAACQRRFAAPHASFLFHPMRWTSEDQARLPAAKSWSGEFERLSALYEEFLVDHLPVSQRTLRAWIRNERYVTAKELFDLGIAEPLDLGEGNIVTLPRRRAQRPPARPAARVRRVV